MKNQLLKYKIIQNSQTPRVPAITDTESFIKAHKEQLKEFLSFSQLQTLAAALAANQVSVNGNRLMFRAFAINDLCDFFNLGVRPGWTLIINPEIEEYIGEKKIKYEGCKSWECNTLKTLRSPKVKVSYYTIDGKKVEGKILSGMKAQVWQHEVNHLNGVVEEKLPKSFLEQTVCKINSALFPLPPIQEITKG